MSEDAVEALADLKIKLQPVAPALKAFGEAFDEFFAKNKDRCDRGEIPCTKDCPAADSCFAREQRLREEK